MSLAAFHQQLIRPALSDMERLCAIGQSVAAERLLLAIGLQESGLRHRYQVIGEPAKPGPARGWWQFERNGGVAGVLSHGRTKLFAETWCHHCRVEPNKHAVWRALEGHDALAVGFARLLLWSSPNPLPETQGEAWREYLECWRPGKPHESTWAKHWAAANETTLQAWRQFT